MKTRNSAPQYLLDNHGIHISRTTLSKLEDMEVLKPKLKVDHDTRTYTYFSETELDRFAKKLQKKIDSGEAKAIMFNGDKHYDFVRCFK